MQLAILCSDLFVVECPHVGTLSCYAVCFKTCYVLVCPCLGLCVALL